MVVDIEPLSKPPGQMHCKSGHVFGRVVIDRATVDPRMSRSEKCGSVAIVLGRDKGMNKIDSPATK